MSVNEVKLEKSKTQLEVKGKGAESSRTFIIGDEDHTLGNSLRHILMQNPDVNFAGYSVPHPMDPFINVRVQTVNEIKATEALSSACKTLSEQCSFILGRVEDVLPEVEEDRIKIEKVSEELRALKMEEEEEEDYDDEGMDTVYE